MSLPIAVIEFYGEPVPASRPRWDSVRRITYTNTKYRNWKKNAANLVSKSWNHLPISEAVAVSIEITLKRPKNKPAKGTVHGRYWHGSQDYPCPTRGDLDNYAKSILDALVQGGLLTDDRIVVELTLTKCAGDTPGAFVQVHIVDPET